MWMLTFSGIFLNIRWAKLKMFKPKLKAKKLTARKPNAKKTAFFTRQNTLPNTLLKIRLGNFVRKNALNWKLLTKNMQKAGKTGKRKLYGRSIKNWKITETGF